MNKQDILNFLNQYGITEKEIVKDFNDYLETEEIEKNTIHFSNVNDYIMGCYYETFDNINNIDNIDSCILRDELLTGIEYIIYKNFNINIKEI